MRTLICTLTAAAAMLALAASGCGDDTDEGAQTVDLGRLCALSAELNENAEQHFSQLDRGATREDFERAHVEFIEENRAEIDELSAVAPEEIRADVETVLAGMRAQAGEEVEVTDAEIDAADERTQRFEAENC